MRYEGSGKENSKTLESSVESFRIQLRQTKSVRPLSLFIKKLKISLRSFVSRVLDLAYETLSYHVTKLSIYGNIPQVDGFPFFDAQTCWLVFARVNPSYYPPPPLLILGQCRSASSFNIQGKKLAFCFSYPYSIRLRTAG